MKNVSTRRRIHLFFFNLENVPRNSTPAKLSEAINTVVVEFLLPLSSLLLNLLNGGFPLTRNFYLRTRVKFYVCK